MSQYPLLFVYLDSRINTRLQVRLGFAEFNALFVRLYFRIRRPLTPMQVHALERIEL